jgi:hypothetical protein
MTELFNELEKAESSAEIEYRKLIYNENDKIFASDIKDNKELFISFLSNNNFSEAKEIEQTNLLRIYYFEYEKRREILNNKLLFIKYNKKVKNGR